MKQIPGLVPPEMVTFVSGTVGPESTLHCLVKGNRSVVVQSTFLSGSAILPRNMKDDDFSPEALQESSRAVYRSLETIQTLLNSIEFGRSNWAFVNQTPDGFHISHRRKSFQHLITCPLWAPFIYGHEIQITRWNSDSHANGYWEGRPVDIWYGWDQIRMSQVNKAMHAGRILRGLDITHEVYGHLLDGDNNVIGLVVEATRGRSIQLGDRTLLYEAVAKLQRHFCIFHGINSGTVLITDGKVRFADLSVIKHFGPDEREEFDEMTDRFHWNELERLFASLEEGLPLLPHYQLLSGQPVVILSHCFSPERPLLSTYIMICIRSLDSGTEPDEYFDSFRRPMLAGNQSVVFEMIRDQEEIIQTPLVSFQAHIAAQKRIHTQRLRSAAAVPQEPYRNSRLTSTQRRTRKDTAPYRIKPTFARPRHQSNNSGFTSESGESRFEEIF